MFKKLKKYCYKKILRRKLSLFFNSKLFSIVSIFTAVILFLILTLSRITASSIWFDEAFSAYIIKFNLADITHYTALDVHPPLYYYLLKAWSTLFGNSLFSLRLMSVVIGVITLILIYILIKKLFNRPVAGLTVVLVAISPMFIRYGIETRMYMLVIMLVILASILLIRLLKTKSWFDYISYGLVVLAGMLTHYWTALFWLTHWIFRYVYIKSDNHKVKPAIKETLNFKWVATHVLIFCLYLPWVPIVLNQAKTIKSGGFWINSINFSTIPNFLAEMFLYLKSDSATNYLAILLIITSTAIIALLIKLFKQDYNKLNVKFIGLMAFVPIVALLILSLPPLSPTFIERYILASTIFILSLISIALFYLKNNTKLKITSLLLVLTCLIFGINQVFYQGNYNKSTGSSILSGEIIQKINQSDSKKTPIISLSPYGYYETSFYGNKNHPVLFLYKEVKDSPIGSLAMLKDDKFGDSIKDLNDFESRYMYAWLVGTTDKDKIQSIRANWQAIKTITVSDPVTKDNQNKATLYRIKQL